MKKMLTAILSGAAALSLFACTAPEKVGSASSVKLTFCIWDEVQQPVFERIIEKFEEENPDIDVELQLTPWSQYWTKLDAAMGADSAADVFWMNTFLPKYASAGLLEALDGYLEKDGIAMDAYVASSAGMCRYEGRQYGMPKGLDTVQLFYNKEIFREYGVEEPKPGWTWEDMVKKAEELKAKSSEIYPILMELDPQPSYFNFIVQSGGYILDESGKKTGLGEPGSIEAYRDIVELMDQRLMPDARVLSDTKGTDLFLSKKGAMLFMGSWKCSLLDQAGFGDQIAAVPMPLREKGNQSVIGGLSYAMNANCKNKEAAWKLIRYLSGEEANRMQAEEKIDIPALKSAQQYYHAEHIDTAVLFEAADSGFPYPTSLLAADWNQVISDYSGKIFAKELSPEEGCRAMQKEVQDILDKEQT